MEFVDKNGVVVTVDPVASVICYVEAASGQVCNVSKQEFDARFLKRPGSEKRLVHVRTDSLPKGVAIAGYANATTENGVITAYFPFDSVAKLSKYVPELKYKANERSWAFEDLSTDPSEWHKWHSMSIMINGSMQEMFCIGWECWSWKEVESEANQLS